MLRAIVILGLATTALAIGFKSTHEQVISIGSVGTSFVSVKGIIVPTTPTLFKGMPAFELKGIVNGVPTVETDKIFFRCSMLSDFYVPHGKSSKPVLLCRNDAFEKATAVDTGTEKMAFLLSAEHFVLPHGVHDIELALGRSFWKTLITSHAAHFGTGATGSVGTFRMEKLYDGYRILTSTTPFETMLTYDIPTMRFKRQFGGLGFSGSGAQAGSASFGGGGGFGGFPGGGGFGGGFSGSQAGASAGSVGGGGGFFG